MSRAAYSLNSCSPARNYKAVQTAFSSVDFLTFKRKHCYFNTILRRTKSQDDLRRNYHSKSKDELLEWIREIQKVNKTEIWTERLKKLAEKLKKPGGEEKIRRKIERYLESVPSYFSECDEDGQQFRQQLPDNIINKLKKISLKLKGGRQSPVQIYKVELPKSYDAVHTKKGDIRQVVRSWLKDISIKKEDSPNLRIRKEDIYNFIIYRLKPYMSYRPDSSEHYRNVLRVCIMEIVNEIPIATDEVDKKAYISKITEELVDELLKNIVKYKHKNRNSRLSHRKSAANFQSSYNLYYCTIKNRKPTAKDIKDFVTDEMTRFLKKTEIIISRKRMLILEMELTELFAEAIELNEVKSEDLKGSIKFLLKDIGKLSGNYAKYFTKILTRDFKDIFYSKSKKIYGNKSKSRVLGNAFSETYLVLHNSPKNQNNEESTTDFPQHTTTTKMGLYGKQIEEEINDWLTSYGLVISSKNQHLFRKIAVNDLAGDIVDRKKYLQLNPSSRYSEEDETQNLKFQIYKWLGKLVGNKILFAIDRAPELMERIKNIPVPKLNNVEDRDKHIELPKITRSNQTSKAVVSQNKTYGEQLYDEIFGWFKDDLQSSDEEKFKKQLVKNLAVNIEKGVKENNKLGDVIEEEIDTWTRKFLNEIPMSNKSEKLKERVKNVPFKAETNDVSLQVEAVMRSCAINTEFIVESTSQERLSSGYYNTKSVIVDLDIYFKKIVNQIEDWLNALDLTVLNKNPYKDVAVRDLAADIVDRYRYIEMNPSSRGTEEDELANLKYEIFKWINKLVGKENLQTIERAPELMERIQRIQGPLLAQSRDRSESRTCRSISPNRQGDDDANSTTADPAFSSMIKLEDKYFNKDHMSDLQSSKAEIISGIYMNQIPMLDERRMTEDRFRSRSTSQTDNLIDPYINCSPCRKTKCKPSCNCINKTKQEIHSRSRDVSPRKVRIEGDEEDEYNIAAQTTMIDIPNGVCSWGFTDGLILPMYQIPNFGPTGHGGSLREEREPKTDKRMSSPARLAIPNILEPYDIYDGIQNLPEGMSIKETYEYFDNIFKDRSKELPLDSTTPDKALVDLARQAIYNAIWKTYFKLKSDPNIENDYALFEATLEHELDLRLDILPQTQEIQRCRQRWKSKTISDVITMLRYIHSITDAPSFRKQLAKRFQRQFLTNEHIKYIDMLQHAFVARAADAYVLYTKYKIDNPVKANIYRQRLMKRIEELVEDVKKNHNVTFQFIRQEQLQHKAFEVLRSVPIPDDETLKDEVEEILIGDEIEDWYNELPVQDLPEVKIIYGKRMRELLANKFHKMEKLGADDLSLEREMRHDALQFLEKNRVLQPNQTLNINFMVDQLMTRLKNRRDQQKKLVYNMLAQEKSRNSSLNEEPKPLTPLIEVQIKRKDNLRASKIPNGIILGEPVNQNIAGGQILEPARLGPDLITAGQFQGQFSQGITPNGAVGYIEMAGNTPVSQASPGVECDAGEGFECRSMHRYRRYGGDMQLWYRMPIPCPYF